MVGPHMRRTIPSSSKYSCTCQLTFGRKTGVTKMAGPCNGHTTPPSSRYAAAQHTQLTAHTTDVDRLAPVLERLCGISDRRTQVLKQRALLISRVGSGRV